MERLEQIAFEFWKWTNISADKWNAIDILDIGVDLDEFPRLGEMQEICRQSINEPLTDSAVDSFLLCMAVDAESEYILDYCRAFADTSFLRTIIEKGVHHVQSEARWQMAELLHLEIPGKDKYLSILMHDSNAYVRKRAKNTVGRGTVQNH